MQSTTKGGSATSAEIADEPVPLTEPADGVPPVTDSEAALRDAVARLGRARGPLAVDAERASGFRYGQRAYLVQLRRQDAGTVLLDPLALPDLAALVPVANDAEWVLHAADQDLPCLRELELRPARLFDTELASRLLGRTRVGLASVVADCLGLALAKEHSAADWSTRPLPESWLRYAALDVELLLELRDVLTRDLEEAGKLSWALEEFEHVRTAPPPEPRPEPWRRTSGLQAVKDVRGLAVARSLWEAREELAERLDRAPGRVLPAAAIVAAAVAKPASVGELGRLKEFSGKRVRRDYWYGAVARAMELPEKRLPTRRAPQQPGTLPAPRSWPDKNPGAATRLDRVRTTVRALAEELRLPQENLLSPATQRRLAWEIGDHPSARKLGDRLTALGARRWQVELVTDPLTEALA
ncbi:HRDC domain-containing protein [Georgenia alba]|uniref:HRDC domain-containing protein n=1 Tax=Georgenia alba TaxID=2233858 RepID=A0ABW2Q9G4_9MICO